MEGGAAPPSPAAGPPPPPPPVVYPWYQPPPKKDDTNLVIILVVVIVVVVILPIVLAGVLYVMVSGLIGTGNPPMPMISLTPATPCGAGCYEIRVADAEPPSSLFLFAVALILPDSGALSGPLQAGTVLGDGGMFLNFSDRGATGMLDAPDLFLVSNLTAAGSYELVLIWTPAGTSVARVTWVH